MFNINYKQRLSAWTKWMGCTKFASDALNIEYFDQDQFLPTSGYQKYRNIAMINAVVNIAGFLFHFKRRHCALGMFNIIKH